MNAFVIFGMGRTGSSLLATLLSSHPQIHCDGEVFRLGAWRRPLQPLAHMWQRYPMPYLMYRQLKTSVWPGKFVYGFKLHTKPNTEQLVDTPGFLRRAYATGWKVIYLQRTGLFDQVISELVAYQTRRYFGQYQPEPALELTISLEQFHDCARRVVQRRYEHQQLLRTIPHLLVTYEDELAESTAWLATITRICDYLAVPAPASVTSPVAKPWSRPYTSLVLNYAELQAAFSDYAAQALRATAAPCPDW